MQANRWMRGLNSTTLHSMPPVPLFDVLFFFLCCLLINHNQPSKHCSAFDVTLHIQSTPLRTIRPLTCSCLVTGLRPSTTLRYLAGAVTCHTHFLRSDLERNNVDDISQRGRPDVETKFQTSRLKRAQHLKTQHCKGEAQNAEQAESPISRKKTHTHETPKTPEPQTNTPRLRSLHEKATPDHKDS